MKQGLKSELCFQLQMEQLVVIVKLSCFDQQYIIFP